MIHKEENMKKSRLKPFKKILLIQWINGIGDLVFTLPAYHVIREHFPDAHLAFLATKKNAILLKGFRGLDEILTIDREIFYTKQMKEIFKTIITIIKEIRQKKFELVVDFTSSGESAWLSLISGAEERWGFLKKSKKLRALKYTCTVEKSLNLHQVDSYLKLVEKGGLSPTSIKNEFILPDEEMEKPLALYKEWGLSWEKPTIFFHI